MGKWGFYAKSVIMSLKMFSFTKIFCTFKMESVYLWNETQYCMISIYYTAHTVAKIYKR